MMGVPTGINGAVPEEIEYTGPAGPPRHQIHPQRDQRLATKRPSYLKRQKEQQRLARAQNKREAKRERKRARDEMSAAPEAGELEAVSAEAGDVEGEAAETQVTSEDSAPVDTPVAEHGQDLERP